MEETTTKDYSFSSRFHVGLDRLGASELHTFLDYRLSH